MCWLRCWLLPVSSPKAPGWGWVNRLGTYVSNGGRGENGVAGLGRDAAGNLYLAGTYVGTPAFGSTVATNLGETDVFLAKYDPAGNLLWLRTLQSAGFDAASALVVEPSGRCTLTGTFGGGLTGGNLFFGSFETPFSLAGPALLGLDKSPFGYGSVPFIAAIDAAGALQWADRPTPTYGLGVVGLHRDNSGNCYISATMAPRSTLTVNGQTYPSVGSIDAVLIKYTVAGQPAWVRRVGAPGVSTNCADVYTDNADAVYWLVGHTGTISIDQVTVGVNSSVGANSLVKLSAGNRVRWIKNNLLRIGADNVVSEFLDLDAGNNALYFSCGSVGGAISYTGSGSPPAVPANIYTECVARCDTAGQIQWVKPVLFATDIATLQRTDIQGFIAGGNGFTFVTKTVSFGTTFLTACRALSGHRKAGWYAYCISTPPRTSANGFGWAAWQPRVSSRGRATPLARPQ